MHLPGFPALPAIDRPPGPLVAWVMKRICMCHQMCTCRSMNEWTDVMAHAMESRRP